MTLRELVQKEAAVLRNTLALGIIQVANYLAPLITLPYLVRTVGVEKYGVLAFATAFVQYFIILTDYGFNISATREISVHRADRARVSRIVSSVLAIRLGILLLSLGIAVAAVHVDAKLAANAPIILMACGSVAANAFSMNWFFQGMERMGYITALSVSGKLAYMAGLFLCVRQERDYVLVPILIAGAEMLAAVAGVTIAIRSFGVRLLLPGIAELHEQLRQGWHVFASTVAISAYTTTRTFAIGMFTDARTTGFYALADKLATLVQMFPLAPLLAALYPRLSSLYGRAPRATWRLVRRLQRYTDMALLGLMPLAMLLAPIPVRLLAKEPYPEAVMAFRILLLSVWITNANAFRVQFLLVSGAQAVYARIHAAAGLVGSVLVVAASYAFSYLGPPVAMVAISSMILLWTMSAVRMRVSGKYTKRSFFHASSARWLRIPAMEIRRSH